MQTNGYDKSDGYTVPGYRKKVATGAPAVGASPHVLTGNTTVPAINGWST